MIPIPIDPRLRKSPITDHLPMNTQNQYVREIKERKIFGLIDCGNALSGDAQAVHLSRYLITLHRTVLIRIHWCGANV